MAVEVGAGPGKVRKAVRERCGCLPPTYLERVAIKKAKQMKALLLGAAGMLGRDLASHVPAGISLVSLTRSDLDITDYDQVRRQFRLLAPDLVLNAAAWTRVDDAERSSTEATLVNSEAVGVLSDIASRTSTKIVHFSTDYVFEGASNRPYTETDLSAPLNVYGRTKLAGETKLLARSSKHLVVRTQWLFGDGPCFVRTILRATKAGKTLRIVNDQTGRPTSSADVSRATWELVRSEASGIFHVANGGSATWYDLAIAIKTIASIDTEILPCRTVDFPRPARRPAYSVLDTTKFDRFTGLPLRHWSEALEEFLTHELESK